MSILRKKDNSWKKSQPYIKVKNKWILSNPWIKVNGIWKTKSKKTLFQKILEDNPPKAGRTDFSIVDKGTPTLYSGTDDQGTTYYFSGDGTNMNNWVSFAGNLWRIIRINGNNSVRLLYAGSGGEDGYLGSVQAYNSSFMHPQYVGWKYTNGDSLTINRGNTTKSSVYTTLETWFNGLDENYKKYIDMDAIYCNDRNIGSGTYTTTGTFSFAAYTRLVTNKTPTFKSSEKSDKFTGTKGDIPVGLMTADEVAFAGGLYATMNWKTYYYLNANGGSSTGSKGWWTMSPFDFKKPYANVFYVEGSGANGRMSELSVYNSLFVRPVISIKASVLVKGGGGTATDPYTLSLQ